jgi:hypothetical protein
MGFLTFIIVVALFINLFFTSITSPILYNAFAPVRRRRRRRRSTVQKYADSSDTLSLVDNLEFIARVLEHLDKFAEL